MTKAGEELQVGSGYPGMESLPSSGFPLSGVHRPQQPTPHHLHSVAREALSFLGRQGLTGTTFSGATGWGGWLRLMPWAAQL